MSSPPTPSRADALRRRRQILDAALELLSEDPDSSFAQIAHAAGVGQATVYRHFADRQDLVAALLEDSLARTEALVEADSGRPDSFARLLQATVAEQVRCQGLISVLRREDVDHPRVEQLTSRVLDLFEGPLSEAKRSGQARADLELEDVLLLLAMIDGALMNIVPVERDATAERALRLLLQGVAPDRG